MKKNHAAKKNHNGRKQSSHFPPGWDKNKVQEVIDHYDNQTDEERAAEIEAAAEAEGETLIAVPTKLIPDVLKLIKRRQKAPERHA